MADRVLVTGATSQVGVFLLPRLGMLGFEVEALSRVPCNRGDDLFIRSKVVDLSEAVDWASLGHWGVTIHLAPLWLLPNHVAHLARRGVGRIVALSSTSVLTKQQSRSSKERAFAASLAATERRLAEECRKAGIDWTLFRPTMIYGAGIDRNVSDIARFIRLFRCFPIIGKGVGLRQPIHADDLAKACIDVLVKPKTFGRIYELGGSEAIAYRCMVERIFNGLGIRPCYVSVPTPVLRGLLQVLKWLPGYRHLAPEMVDRVDMDLVFSCEKAAEDFGFAPRAFSYESGSRMEHKNLG